MLKSLFIVVLSLLGCTKSESLNVVSETEKPVPISLPKLGNIAVVSLSTTQAILKTKVESSAGSSVTDRGICWALHNNPTIDDSKASPTVISGSGEYEVRLTNLEGGKVYYAKAYASNSKGRSYGPFFEFKVDSYNDAKMEATDILFYKLNSVELSSKIETSGGADIKEVGFCVSANHNPTVNDRKVVASNIENMRFKADVNNLELGKNYFVRSYIVTAKGTYYGSQREMQTYNKGKITVKFNDPSSIPTDVYERLKSMADFGVKILEEHTSIVKTVTIEYNPGVATADASLTGWMRWGSNTSYQKTGTFLHEFAHAIGAGTSDYWRNTLIKNGIYTGRNANLALQKAANDKSAQLKGDALHFWPYGINGAHEDTGLESDYIIIALIIEGFKRDGIAIN